MLATGGSNRTLTIWGNDTKVPYYTDDFGYWVDLVRFSPDGRYLAAINKHEGGFLFDIKIKKKVYEIPVQQIQNHTGFIFSSDSKTLAVSGNLGENNILINIKAALEEQ